MILSRDDFLQVLDSVSPAVAAPGKNETVAQCTCFVFTEGRVVTYNHEIACVAPSGLDRDLTAAVDAQPLLALLRSLTEAQVAVDVRGGRFRVRAVGKRKFCRIRTDLTIQMPLKDLETPGKKDWKALHPDFSEGIATVQECAGKNESEFGSVCIHVTKGYVEATDRERIARYRVRTGINPAILIRRDYVKHIVPLGMIEYAETPSWIHFRNEAKVILSCHRYVGDYPDLTDWINFTGTPITLPGGLDSAAKIARIFSNENPEYDHVKLELGDGDLLIEGSGPTGEYTEIKKIDYRGKSIRFMIPPNLLVEILKKNTQCEIHKDRLKVDGGKWVFVSKVMPVPDKKK